MTNVASAVAGAGPVLITGATGLLGGWLTKAVIESGAEVVALVRSPHERHAKRIGRPSPGSGSSTACMSGGIAVHVSGQYPGLDMELWAIRNS